MRCGVHLANDGNVTDEHLDLIRNLRIVKGLVRLDCNWDEINWPRLADNLREDCTVVLRLFFPGRLEAGEFVARASRKLPPVLTALGERECYIEIHNEPNLASGAEGWGMEQADAEDFAGWYAAVLHGLRAEGFTRLGFPGLAVSEWQHGERTWARENALNIQRSDWVGVHCYWQTVQEIENARLGLNWQWYRSAFPRKKIIVTEAGNSGCDGPMGAPSPGEQIAQYVRWCRLAASSIYGVTFFILGGSEHWQGFQIWPETVRALEAV